MKNIENILADLGIEVPEEKSADLKKLIHENYKTVAEFEKLETKANSYKEQADNVKETIAKFENIDVDAMNKELADWKRRSEEAEANFKKEIYDRDFEDALNKEFDSIKFTSKSARATILNKVKNAGIQLKDGKLYGFADVMNDIKNEDEEAFVDETQSNLEANRVMFTKPIENTAPTSVTKESILAIADREERRKAIKNNPDLFS